MGDIGDAYAEWTAMRPRKCICGECPQGHPSGLCDACVAKRSASERARRLGAAHAPTPTPAPGLDLDAVDLDFRSAMEGPPGNRSAIKFYHETWPALIAEVRALRLECASLRRAWAADKDAVIAADNIISGAYEGEKPLRAAIESFRAKLAEAKRLGLIAARVVLDDDTDLPAIAAALEAL